MSTGDPRVSSERAFLSDARLILAVVNEARYPVLHRVFGVSRKEVNLLTVILALGAAEVTLGVARRVVRHPWPLDWPDTAMAGFAVREAGFSLAGPAVREGQLFGALIVFAGVGGLVIPRVRRTLRTLHDAQERVVEQRRRVYEAAQEAVAGRGRPAPR